MPRLLVVVDGSVEAAEALSRALDMAQAIAGSEIVLLGIEPVPKTWELRRHRGRSHPLTAILARARDEAEARAVRTSTRCEFGEKAEIVMRVASQEDCDQIFVTEGPSTVTARALRALSAACTGGVAGQIISETGLPVTVIAPKDHR